MTRYGALALSALLLALPAPARAQEDTVPRTVGDARLPAEVAARVAEFYNDPRTTHFTGRTRIPAGTALQGDVAALGGPLIVAGRIEGDLVVINGDLEFVDGASVTGDVTVVGGAVLGLEEARVDGEVVVYSAPLEYRRRGDRLVLRGRAAEEYDEDDAAEGERSVFRSDARRGRADFVVATGQSYNRVEGLPITFGPVIETRGSNPLRIRAMAIYRTEEGAVIEPARWGYEVRAEQFLGGRGALRVGGAVRSVIDPIEDWHLSKLENGLSTFFLHRDYRDHYEREGWSAFATLAPRGSPLSATVEYRSERHRTVPAGSPWTLFHNDDPWRPQPLVGQGTLNSVALRAAWDTRSHEDDPSTGWHVRGELEQAVGGGLARPAAYWANSPLDVLPGPLVPEREYDDFLAGTIDIRRYNRISPSSRLNFRLMAGGSLDGSALPPQRQHALGGEGSLPGFGLFSLDCGARARRFHRASDWDRADRPVENRPPEYFEGYGCDRFVLFQAEYRGDLSFRFDWRDDDEGEGVEGDVESFRGDVGWVLFADAGGGWSRARGGSEFLHDEDTAVDVGAGILLGDLGVYAALPVSRDGGLNVFIRLRPRF